MPRLHEGGLARLFAAAGLGRSAPARSSRARTTPRSTTSGGRSRGVGPTGAYAIALPEDRREALRDALVTAPRAGRGAVHAGRARVAGRPGGPLHSANHEHLQERTRFEPAEVEPRIFERWLDPGCTTRSRRARRRRTTRSRSRRRTSPARCTWATRSTARSRTRSSATHRMRGKRTKWILGTDHAGIATQKQVEKRLAARARAARSSAARRSSSASGSGASEYGGTIIEQFKRLGATLDYDDERFTIDEALRPRGARGLRRRSTSRASSTATTTWSTGTRARGRRSPTSRSRTARSTDTLYYDRLPARAAATGRSRSPPCARRRCWPTRRSP